jgi:hypothetical protein
MSQRIAGEYDVLLHGVHLFLHPQSLDILRSARRQERRTV